jgi:hypothetical protein
MKLRFGEFPTHHYFVDLLRPVVDWTFKFIGWLVIVSTFNYAYETTGNPILFYVKWALYLLLGQFVWGFIEWFFEFRFYPRAIPGKEILDAVARTPAIVTPRSVAAKIRVKIWQVTRRLAAVLLSIAITVTALVTVQTAVRKTVDAIVEFQKHGRG